MAGREPYSPKYRTALVLTGAGTAGAYHAGVLRALGEAGVRIDLVAGHGIGAVGAFFAAIEGGPRLWADDGVWRQEAVRSLYAWRPVLRALGWAVAAALGLVLVPLAVLAAGLVVFPAALLLRLVHLDAGSALADSWTAVVREAFEPGRLPAWIPQASLLLVLAVLVMLGAAARRARVPGRQRERGRFWWRVWGAPLDCGGAIRYWQRALWRLMTGGARAAQPGLVDLSRRYAELITENLGQPGFRELLVLVHDLDTRRDVVLAALAEPFRRSFFGRRAGAAASAARTSETLDLAGADRDHAVDVLSASQCLPVVSDPWPVRFSPESHWKGETHLWCDRPGSAARLLEEVAAAGAEQVIVASAAAVSADPHTLTGLRLDGRGRLGAWLASEEAAAVRDAVRARAECFRFVQQISPAYNPLDPMDFAGTYDERSDRVQLLGELVDRGYADAYGQFIDPAVGAGEARF
ncbi:MAG TPA: hypothetical protein PLE61_09105 [Vicinamibacterales bacterium]|nr:hypothetical protein [Vicinamibacterales bacterium]